MIDTQSPASIAIVGCGLMGGSLGLALAERTPTRIGVDMPDHQVDRTLITRGAVTSVCSLADACERVECIVIATPISEICAIVEEVASVAKPGTLIIDIGSVKGNVAQIAMSIDRPDIHIVPTHPMCGSHESGSHAARSDMYTGATWALTPTDRTSPAAINQACELIRAAGAVPVVCDAHEHDEIVARTSHLIRIAAGGLALQRKQRDLIDGRLLAGGGFNDATRLARGDVDMWHGILTSNRTHIAAALRSLIATLDECAAHLEHGDEAAIRGFLQESHHAAHR